MLELELTGGEADGATVHLHPLFMCSEIKEMWAGGVGSGQECRQGSPGRMGAEVLLVC